MQMTTLREARESDVPQIMRIERAAFTPPWTEAQILREIYGGDTCFCVAEQNGILQGFAILRFIADEAELFQLAVEKTAQRTGIGTKLLQETLNHAPARTVFLEVRASNAPAISLYQKQGFTERGRRPHYYTTPHEDAIIMHRTPWHSTQYFPKPQ
ncbi:MAG: ribosomal protein S18-alanine N-acetyltransferase [Oscillospiraceae bacterium]|jgi:ribosomal-protein-alanine N-acetyltransferase|nr:ribosomal protein S18-alanine N-acetyltransferase [Oscillospiraceae bacterium]